MASSEYRVEHLGGDGLRLFTSARMLAIALAPYLAIGMFRLRPLAAPGLGTIAVDRWWRLYIDPGVFSSWSLPERALSLLHEVSHLIRDHAQRCDALAAEPRLFNLAADAEINDDLDRFEPPPNSNIQYEGVPGDWIVPGRLRPSAPENLLAEVYYLHLTDHASLPCATGSSPALVGNGGTDGSSWGPLTTTAGALSSPEQKGRDEVGGREPRASPDHASGHCCGYGDGTCGSGAGGSRRPWEIPENDDLAPGVDRATADLVRRQVAHATVVYAKARGRVPDGMVRWAEGELDEPKVSWRRVLSGAIKRAIAHRAGQVDFSYQRPGRRRVPRVIMPSMRRPLPSVAVVVDTSGSMSTGDLRSCLGEVKGIAAQVGIRGRQLRLLQVDAAVHSVEPVFDVHKIDCHGGGGTDMTIGIHAAENLRPRPDVIVVLTDGATPWPSDSTSTRLVIGIVGTEATINEAFQSVPGWATAVGICSDDLAGGSPANGSSSTR